MKLFITLLVGLFTVAGALLVILSKNNKKVIDASVCLAFGVMVSLGILELLPEAYELITLNVNKPYNIGMLVLCVVVGVFILRTLDNFVPDHEHDHKNDKEHKLNLFHIGIISSIALVIHNIIEGITLYSTLVMSLSSGVMMGLAIGIHNIPIGMVIASTFYKKTNSKLKTILISVLISLSTFIGALLTYLCSGYVMSELFEGILLAITLGMLVHISIFELLPQIKEIDNKKFSVGIIILGIIIMLISLTI
ncbi:MAG: hypothetical protein E7173_02945 [Firmicutes bacterium]|nr:hypothetical protein [Bacillota bacterium]